MAIIGHGDIAKILPARDDLLFFASGVSNSQETRESEYQREIALLSRQPRNKRIVYFSSLSVFYSDSRYANHKRAMELIIKKYSKYYCIIRIGNISWGNNPHTLINHFKNRIAEGRHITIENTYRCVIDKEEFLYWINMIPSWNVEMNCPGRLMKVEDIAREYAGFNTR